MASFSTYTTSSSSSLILLFHLSLLTTGNLFLRTNAAALDDACRQTRDPPRCLAVFAYDSRSKAAPPEDLEQIAVDTAEYIASQNKNSVHDLMLRAMDPNLRALYLDCENLYIDALSNLVAAQGLLQTHSYGKLVEVAGVVSVAVSGCERAVANLALNRPNEDVGILADAIAVIAKTL